MQSLVNKWRSSREGGNTDLRLEHVAAVPELLCFIDKEAASVERIDDLKKQQAKLKERYPHVQALKDIAFGNYRIGEAKHVNQKTDTFFNVKPLLSLSDLRAKDFTSSTLCTQHVEKLVQETLNAGLKFTYYISTDMFLNRIYICSM